MLSRFTAVRFLLIIVVIIVAFACSGEKKDTVPERDADAAQPERSIDQPLKAERITEEEHAEAVQSGKSLIDNPELPFDIDVSYAYIISRDDIEIGASEFIFVKEDDWVKVEGVVIIEKDGDELKNIEFTYTFDSRLRVRMCEEVMPGFYGDEALVKRVDFSGEKIGVEYSRGPVSEVEQFVELEHPEEDTWPFLHHTYVDIAIIGACINPLAENVDVSVLSLMQDSIDIYSLEFVGESEIILKAGTETVAVREYEGFINGKMYGYFYFDDSRRLVMVDEIFGFYAELVTVSPSPDS